MSEVSKIVRVIGITWLNGFDFERSQFTINGDNFEGVIQSQSGQVPAPFRNHRRNMDSPQYTEDQTAIEVMSGVYQLTKEYRKFIETHSTKSKEQSKPG